MRVTMAANTLTMEQIPAPALTAKLNGTISMLAQKRPTTLLVSGNNSARTIGMAIFLTTPQEFSMVCHLRQMIVTMMSGVGKTAQLNFLEDGGTINVLESV